MDALPQKCEALKVNETSSTESTFATLPFDLKCMILKELNIISFSRFKRTSKEMFSLCKEPAVLPVLSVLEMSCKSREEGIECWGLSGTVNEERSVKLRDIPLDAVKIRVHEDEVFRMGHFPPLEFSDEDCNMFAGRDVRFNAISISGGISCAPDNFNKFLKDHHVRVLRVTRYCDIPNGNELLALPAVQKLVELEMDRTTDAPISAENVLSLSATKFKLGSVEPSVVQVMLKEWQEGTRTIDSVTFEVHGLVSARRDSTTIPHIKSKLLDGLDYLINLEEEKPKKKYETSFLEAEMVRPDFRAGDKLIFRFSAHEKQETVTFHAYLLPPNSYRCKYCDCHRYYVYESDDSLPPGC